MSRKQNDTGRGYEFAVIEKFKQNDYALGPLAQRHHSFYQEYFDSQTPDLQALFIKSASEFYIWFTSKFGSQVAKCVDGLPDNSGSVVDIVIGSPSREVNFSLKHNHLAMRHNRPHGLPERCGIANTPEAIKYLENVYEIEKAMRLNEAVTKFSKLKRKKFWMREINDNCMKAINDWKIEIPSTVSRYFGFLTGNDRPYYKLVLNSRGNNMGSYIHEFISASMPSTVDLSYNKFGHLVMAYNNGWTLKKRLHNAQSLLDHLDMENLDQTTDWKWDVSLVTHPNPVSYKI